MRQCKYLKEIQTDKPHQVQKIPRAENRQILGEDHVYLLYSFPAVAVSKHETLVRPTLGLNTYSHFYGYFHIPWSFQLLLSTAADSLQHSRSQGCIKYSTDGLSKSLHGLQYHTLPVLHQPGLKYSKWHFPAWFCPGSIISISRSKLATKSNMLSALYMHTWRDSMT